MESVKIIEKIEVGKEGFFGTVIKEYTETSKFPIYIEEKKNFHYDSYVRRFEFGDSYFVYSYQSIWHFDINTHLFHSLDEAVKYAEAEIENEKSTKLKNEEICNLKYQEIEKEIDNNPNHYYYVYDLDNFKERYGKLVKAFPASVFVNKKSEKSFIVFCIENGERGRYIMSYKEFSDETEAIEYAKETSKAVWSYQFFSEIEHNQLQKEDLRIYGIIIHELPYNIKISFANGLVILYITDNHKVIYNEVFIDFRYAKWRAEEIIKDIENNK